MLVLDSLGMHAFNLASSSVGKAAVNKIATVFESPKASHTMAEVAGVGRVAVEEGAEVAPKIGNIIKNDLSLFKASSQEPISQKIKSGLSTTRWTENIIHKIRNVGDDILDIMERAGGHTLKEHVGQTINDLTRRAAGGKINAASNFTNKRTAINAVKENLRNNAEDIALWLKSNPSLKDQMVVEFSHPHPIGQGVFGGKKNPAYDLVKSRIVLRPDPTQDLGFKIVTAFPVGM